MNQIIISAAAGLADQLHEAVKPAAARSPKWRKLRQFWLERNGECAVCGSRQDLEVHHIIPVHWSAALECDTGNLITLCEGLGVGHHLLVGHLGNYKSYNATVREDAAYFRAKIRNRPMPLGDLAAACPPPPAA